MTTLTLLSSCAHEPGRHTTVQTGAGAIKHQENVYCASSREHTSCSADWESALCSVQLNRFPFSNCFSLDLDALDKEAVL